MGGKKFKFLGLPFAGIEVAKLAQTFSSTTIRQDKDFNLQLVPQMDSFSVVHLATHGAFVVGTPVTLEAMKKWQFKNLDLIVLSACETGLDGNFGTGVEILGLGYRLQTAGARAVIASLWAVNDGGTQALMNAFYLALKKDKITKTEALRQAQIAMINSDRPANPSQRASIEIIQDGVPPEVASRLSHPFYWAPFILIGNGL